MRLSIKALSSILKQSRLSFLSRRNFTSSSSSISSSSSTSSSGGAAAAAAAADLRSPEKWYPAARAMKRRIIFHAGPTNSGKTYNALRALSEAWSGVYCGPLRLLALEVFEASNLDGRACSLMTGQEKRTVPFAKHVSCTVEMVDTEKEVEVAVIDEIQMIGDEARGSAWTRALLGVPAREVHVCGDPAAEPVVAALAAATGDILEVRRYERMTSMTAEQKSLRADYSGVQDGDAVVAFSRKDIYTVRRMIERQTKFKCCVVYGGLPPETRSAQARLFNDPAAGYRVLVASDAIGMGLNLNIRRVVFHTMTKFDGVSVGRMSPSAVKQIAGRAGRRSSIYPAGFATTLHETDLPFLHECLATPTSPIHKAGLFPNPEQLVAFAQNLPTGTPLPRVIELFFESSQLEGPYFLCRGEEARGLAEMLQPFKLPFELRAMLLLTPVNTRNAVVREYYLGYIEQFAFGRDVRLRLQLPLNDPGYLVRDIPTLEAKTAALDVYLWLAHRLGLGLGARFPDVDAALLMRAKATVMLEAALVRLSDDTKGVRGGKRPLRVDSSSSLPSVPLRIGSGSISGRKVFV